MEGRSSYVVKKLINLVLVGRTGTGKSATANSIINEDAFKSRTRAQAVTTLIEGKKIEIRDELTVNVIDTPGLFDFNDGPKSADNEIAKCIGLAQDGINAFIFVLSVKNRFTQEELATFMWLQNYFGEKVTAYMIVIYTNGDQLEGDGESLEDYLQDSPEALKKILKLCDQRVLLFNNRTKSVYRKQKQVDDLLVLVEDICTKNDGKPYTNEVFVELQEARKIKEYEGNRAEGQASFSQHIDKVTEMVERKLAESMKMLEKQLELEVAARKAERIRFEKDNELFKERLMHDRQMEQLRATQAQEREMMKLREEARILAGKEQLEAIRTQERELMKLREEVRALLKFKITPGPFKRFFNKISSLW